MFFPHAIHSHAELIHAQSFMNSQIETEARIFADLFAYNLVHDGKPVLDSERLSQASQRLSALQWQARRKSLSASHRCEGGPIKVYLRGSHICKLPVKGRRATKVMSDWCWLTHGS